MMNMICKICGVNETDNPDDICDKCIECFINTSIEQNIWTFGNSILYDLCKNNMKHECEDKIIAKVWLIGRTYAASIERRKNKDNKTNDDFYIFDVAPKILNSDIDKWIEECSIKKTIDVYLKTHKRITDLFHNISGLEKRSLASKYLHFHLPNMFYIYDSRVSSSIGLLLKHFNVKKFKNNVKDENCDKEYAPFYQKCAFLVDEIRKKYNKNLNCRQFDNLLILIGEKTR